MINGNGSTVHYQYDRRNRLSNLAHKTAAGVLMLGMAYTVDASGLRTSIVETNLNPDTHHLLEDWTADRNLGHP